MYPTAAVRTLAGLARPGRCLVALALLMAAACSSPESSTGSATGFGGGFNLPDISQPGARADAAGMDAGGSGETDDVQARSLEDVEDPSRRGPDGEDPNGDDAGSEPLDVEGTDAESGEPDGAEMGDTDEQADGDEQPDADELSDAEELADTEELQDTGEEEPPPPDVKADTKDAVNSMDYAWYNTPLPDEYTYADTPDTQSQPDQSSGGGGGLPPICSPQIGSVSVTETVGPGGKIDIVIWIDTSGSMSQEAAWVNQNVVKFMNYLATKNLDYRVVMFGNGLGLCNNGCPLNDPQHFLWVKVNVASTNGPNLISNPIHFDKYKGFLRPDAVHNIVAISDDNCFLQSVNFINTYKGLLTNAGMNPAFVYHSIVSFANAANPNQAGNCAGGASYGSFHIAVSQATNGSMFQLCQKDWTVLFDQLAKSVAATAKPVCTYALPAKAGKKYNPGNVKVSHIENSVVVNLTKINAEAECAAHPDGWFYDDPNNPQTATLCNETCKKLVGGALMFNFGCAL